VIFVAIDIGGTFTDLVGFDDKAQTFVEAKSLTTPAQLTQGIVDCIRKSGLNPADIDELIHGSTIAINTLIECKGAKTGLVVTRGTRDVYIIGRGNRPEAYNLFFHRHQPLVPRRLTHEAQERLLASGETHEPLRRDSIAQACAALKAEGIEAIAVCFLHAYANPAHERAAGEMIKAALPDVYLSLSHEILREYREFERMSTTVVNAYIGPKVGGYVKSLKSSLGEIGFRGDLSIMRSNGGVMTPEVATERPAAMMESGPVGGIIASARVGMKLGLPNVISFDMGGTTAKASLVRDGEPTLAPGYYVGGYAGGHPVMLPMIDVVEVGAGGGSIAWLDDVGALKVGPQSAGADPGPVCYGRGGAEPTVTDANLVLGRIAAGRFLGGTMPLDQAAAARAIEERLGLPLGLARESAAAGVVRLADVKMALAVRSITTERGLDPRDYSLVAYGGGGPLHAVAIARELGIPRVIIPPAPSTFSAWGMLATDLRHDLVRTVLEPLERTDGGWAEVRYREMETEIEAILPPVGTAVLHRAADLRYLGQEHTVTVEIGSLADWVSLRGRFDAAHQRAYGYAAPDVEVQLLNLRLAVVYPLERAPLPTLERGSGRAPAFETRKIYSTLLRDLLEYRVYGRDRLRAGDVIEGPAAIEESGTTTMLEPGDRLQVEGNACLVIDVAKGV